jgi:four helix bundle protein
MVTKLRSGTPRPPYERLTAWRACHELALALYRSSSSWPPDEWHGLTADARRASFSAAVALVQASTKQGSREFRRLLDRALASLHELGYVLRILKDLELVETASWGELEALRDHATRLTWGLYVAAGKGTGKTARTRSGPSAPGSLGR